MSEKTDTKYAIVVGLRYAGPEVKLDVIEHKGSDPGVALAVTRIALSQTTHGAIVARIAKEILAALESGDAEAVERLSNAYRAMVDAGPGMTLPRLR